MANLVLFGDLREWLRDVIEERDTNDKRLWDATIDAERIRAKRMSYESPNLNTFLERVPDDYGGWTRNPAIVSERLGIWELNPEEVRTLEVLGG